LRSDLPTASLSKVSKEDGDDTPRISPPAADRDLASSRIQRGA
jgi:hypothetical protein